MKRWFMPKHVVRMACEANAAAISAPFPSHVGDFFLLHSRAGRSFRHFWCMFLICILSLYSCIKLLYNSRLSQRLSAATCKMALILVFCIEDCFLSHLSPHVMRTTHYCLRIKWKIAPAFGMRWVTSVFARLILPPTWRQFDRNCARHHQFA